MTTLRDLEELSHRVNDKRDSNLEPWFEQFGELVSRDVHIALANQIFESVLAGNHTALPSTNGKYILLFNDREVSLAVVRYARPTKDILWSSENFVQRSISPQECVLRQFMLPQGVREDLFDSQVAAQEAGVRPVIYGDLVSKRPESIVDIGGLDSGPVDFVRLSLPPAGNFEWAFSRDTLHATSITTTRYGESNLLGILDLLAQAGNERSEDLLTKLAGHSLHFVRWRAIQSLVQLNQIRGMEILSVAAEDVHPELRVAARRSLENVRSRLEKNQSEAVS